MTAAFLAGCAEAPKHYPSRPTPKKPPVVQPTLPPMPPPAQRANVRPSTKDAVTPQRQASMKLVEKGKALIDRRDPEQAASVLMNAVNVDPSNGVAYYYLAVANEEMGQHDVAMGLCDKAEALLGAVDSWLVRINQLRGGIDEPQKQRMIQSPIDAAF